MFLVNFKDDFLISSPHECSFYNLSEFFFSFFNFSRIVVRPWRKDWAITEPRLVWIVRMEKKSSQNLWTSFFNFFSCNRISDFLTGKKKNPFSSESWHWSFFDIFYHKILTGRKREKQIEKDPHKNIHNQIQKRTKTGNKVLPK